MVSQDEAGSESGSVDENEETSPSVEGSADEFVWGEAREPPDGRGDDTGSGDDTQESDDVSDRLDAIESELETLAETAEQLQLRAMNTSLKLAREETDAIAPIAYDLEADARRTSRATRRIALQVAGLRQRLDVLDEEGETMQESTRNREASTGSGTPAADDATVAGVDLSKWPGHLGPYDFERARAAVRRSVGPDPGDLPPSTRHSALSDDEVPFGVLLTLAGYFGDED